MYCPSPGFRALSYSHSGRPGGNALVILFLKGRHLHPEDPLHLGGQGLLHVLLHPPQEERLQHLVEALVAVLPPLPVVLLEIFPELKPGGETVQCYLVTHKEKSVFATKNYFKIQRGGGIFPIRTDKLYQYSLLSIRERKTNGSLHQSTLHKGFQL